MGPTVPVCASRPTPQDKSGDCDAGGEYRRTLDRASAGEHGAVGACLRCRTEIEGFVGHVLSVVGVPFVVWRRTCSTMSFTAFDPSPKRKYCSTLADTAFDSARSTS